MIIIKLIKEKTENEYAQSCNENVGLSHYLFFNYRKMG